MPARISKGTAVHALKTFWRTKHMTTSILYFYSQSLTSASVEMENITSLPLLKSANSLFMPLLNCPHS